MCGNFTHDDVVARVARPVGIDDRGRRETGETMIGTPMRMVPVIDLDDDCPA